MFGWFKRSRRKKIRKQPWPEAWSLHLNRNVQLTWELSPDEMANLQERVKIFVAEKRWEGCDGLEVTDEIRVTIAGGACLMLLGVPNFYFDNVKTILVFPQAFDRKVSDGVTHGSQRRAGEAWQGGPIILSWRDTLKGGRNEDDGRNLVFHEFAHALDGLDGEMGGQIVFDDQQLMQQWRETIDKEYAELVQTEEDGRRTVLDHYGATNPAEFFAVACEAFFERPRELNGEHPTLFRLMKSYFKVDPHNWQQKRPARRKR